MSIGDFLFAIPVSYLIRGTYIVRIVSENGKITTMRLCLVLVIISNDILFFHKYSYLSDAFDLFHGLTPTPHWLSFLKNLVLPAWTKAR
jgi:hypothetical protein